MLDRLDQVPWADLFHRGVSSVPATDVPVLLRALAERGPTAVVTWDTTTIGAFHRTEHRSPRAVGVELTELIRVSPVTPQLIPFLVELIGSQLEPATRRFCVRWLQGYFKHCTLGFPAAFDLDAAERAASWVEAKQLPVPILRGLELSSPPHEAHVEAALAELRGEFGEVSHLTWELERRLDGLWSRQAWLAIVAGLDTLLATLGAGDEPLAAETIALVSWLPQRRAVIEPRLRALVQAAPSPLLESMAALALARLGDTAVGEMIQVLGDSLEARGELGAPAVYLAAADILASNGLASPGSRRALLKAAREVGKLPDPFTTTMADLIKLMTARLVWPKR